MDGEIKSLNLSTYLGGRSLIIVELHEDNNSNGGVVVARVWCREKSPTINREIKTHEEARIHARASVTTYITFYQRVYAAITPLEQRLKHQR